MEIDFYALMRDVRRALRLAPHQLDALWLPPLCEPVTVTIEGLLAPRGPA